jgi:hypothetical protein
MLQVTNSFTVEDMRRFAGEAWGELGANVVEQWCRFNAAYFDNTLKPVPLVITNTQPFGKRLAYCSYGSAAGSGRTITLNVPKVHNTLLADNNTLLHEASAPVRAWRGCCSSQRRLAARNHAPHKADYRERHLGWPLEEFPPR